MVNAGKVNAVQPCVPEANFYEIFRVFGRFLHSRNSVKYENDFRINHNSVQFRGGARLASEHLFNTIMLLSCIYDFARSHRL